MSEITYDEDPEGVSDVRTELQPVEVNRQSFLVHLVVSTGVVKTKDQALKVLLGVAIVASLLALGPFVKQGSQIPPLTPGSPYWPK